MMFCRLSSGSLLAKNRAREAFVKILDSATTKYQRVYKFSTVSPTLRSASVQDITYLKSLCDTIQLDPSNEQKYNLDWTNQYHGKAVLVLQPRTALEVCEIVKYCYQNRIALVPQGGKTGLVGASVPIHDEVILSTVKMNSIEQFDDYSGILKCQAGCVLQDLHQYCSTRRHMMPLDLGSKGTCVIGGNLGSNAGGQYFYRYGSLAANTVGMNVVTGDGKLLDLNYTKANRKDNTGYKLHQLFIGSEGTLGIITDVAVTCPPEPLARQAAFLACKDYSSVLSLLREAKKELGEILAAFELMDRTVISLVAQTQSTPFESLEHPYYILIETHGSDNDHDQEKLSRLLQAQMENQNIVDGTIAQDRSQLEHFWRIRESANPTVKALGFGYKYDISLPVNQLEEFISVMQSRTSHLDVIQTNWGHVMDGDLHFNVNTPGIFVETSEVFDCLEPFLINEVISRGGSISAEHGIGVQKRKYLSSVHDDNSLGKMKAVKHVFDPAGILNPGKFLS